MSEEDPHPTVIVVDDEPSVVGLICDVLEEEQIPTLPCLSGAAAFSWIRTYHPKVVILDVQMPEVTGIEVFEQLRADTRTAEIPVIFLTANAHILYAKLPDFPARGAIVLPKPFNIVTLITQVRQYLPPA